ncbi:unnamed protein product [Tilletia controversa]|uniref:DASH complex subunit DAM1 n=3 Tax=Tilletia TaxID=13289 RepID=A0A8X7SWN6_9BASI|nr:hypothetical protein CF336_g5822 [Tilletia laevis]KAE8194084.1 hypothetical protein CF328_g4865 [Tilletia controversa]KAE8256705.1 hypothetical protein A4X03_0g5143 [Tilletia caries]KAE8195522.1 hypothetical protein CF335_g5082 [Tilletia laevis]KAE8246516.1 hypothetical protein A4X06_0g4987 [Tilletia controversa]
MTSPHRVTTPLRRISRGSIPALRQSQSHNDPSGFGGEAGSSYGPGGSLSGGGGGNALSSSGLGGSIGGGGGSSAESPLAFMTAAMADLSHETSILQSNLEAVNSIHEALGVFGENFSMYLYGLKMNAFCVEWAEAPTEENFERADETQDLLRAQREQQSSILSGVSYSTFAAPQDTGSVSFDGGSVPGSVSQEFEEPSAEPARRTSTGAASPRAPAAGTKGSASSATGGGTAVKKPGQITVGQKKQRLKFAADIIETLPLEYRSGRDPKPRKIAETVILALIAAGPSGVRSMEIVSPPDLPQGKVNMTLLALVKAKHALRTSSNGVVFSLDPARHPRLPP